MNKIVIITWHKKNMIQFIRFAQIKNQLFAHHFRHIKRNPIIIIHQIEIFPMQFTQWMISRYILRRNGLGYVFSIHTPLGQFNELVFRG